MGTHDPPTHATSVFVDWMYATSPAMLLVQFGRAAGVLTLSSFNVWSPLVAPCESLCEPPEEPQPVAKATQHAHISTTRNHVSFLMSGAHTRVLARRQ